MFYPMTCEHTIQLFFLSVQLSFLEMNDNRFWLTLTLTLTEP